MKRSAKRIGKMKKLKKTVIAEAMETFGKIYIHSIPHQNLIIGERGLINNEKNNGIVLAIGSASCSEFRMEEDFIFAKLRFNGMWEDVFIPYEAVDAILNDLHKPLFIFNFPYYAENEERITGVQTQTQERKTEPKKKAVIVKPDFTKSKESGIKNTTR